MCINNLKYLSGSERKDLLYLFIKWGLLIPQILSKIIVLQPGTNNRIKLNTSFAQMLSFLIAWNFTVWVSKTHYNSHYWDMKAVGTNRLYRDESAQGKGLGKGMGIHNINLYGS